MSETPPLGDWHQTVRCKSCGEMIDARAATCYLCGDAPQHERNVALINAVHTERVNANILGQANGARQDAAVNVPMNPRGVSQMDRQSWERFKNGGKPLLHGARGASDLVAHYKQELQKSGFGE